MNVSLEITKKSFKIRRQVSADILIFGIGFFCYFVLPFCGAMGGYLMLVHSNPEKAIKGLLGLSFLMLLISTMIFFIVALREKKRLPIRMELTNHFFVLVNKKGKQWKIRYANCRYADSFIRCFLGNFSRGTWSHGVTIYIPKEHLPGFPRGLGDVKEYPPDMSFHFPVRSVDKPEIVSFLECKNCRQIPPVTLGEMLLALFAPAFSLWIHVAAALFLYNQIGEYGVLGLVVIGMISGMLAGPTAITTPYRRIEYLRNKRSVKLNIYGLLALSIGWPIFLWITQNAIQPNLFAAVFVTFLCYVESYLWIYCLLRQERPSGIHESRERSGAK